MDYTVSVDLAATRKRVAGAERVADAGRMAS